MELYTNLHVLIPLSKMGLLRGKLVILCESLGKLEKN